MATGSNRLFLVRRTPSHAVVAHTVIRDTPEGQRMFLLRITLDSCPMQDVSDLIEKTLHHPPGFAGGYKSKVGIGKGVHCQLARTVLVLCTHQMRITGSQVNFNLEKTMNKDQFDALLKEAMPFYVAYVNKESWV